MTHRNNRGKKRDEKDRKTMKTTRRNGQSDAITSHTQQTDIYIRQTSKSHRQKMSETLAIIDHLRLLSFLLFSVCCVYFTSRFTILTFHSPCRYIYMYVLYGFNIYRYWRCVVDSIGRRSPMAIDLDRAARLYIRRADTRLSSSSTVCILYSALFIFSFYLISIHVPTTTS